MGLRRDFPDPDFVSFSGDCDFEAFAASRVEYERRPKTRDTRSAQTTNARVHDAAGPGVKERVCQSLRWSVALRDRLRLKALLTVSVIEKVELP
jgi:hypothetical protein